MIDRIERELDLEATPEEVWATVTGDGWLADHVALDLRPGGEASFCSREERKRGWIEEVRESARLVFWWAGDGEPATRVELTLSRAAELTRLRIIESRPLEALDLVGLPLPGASGPTFGPALVAA